MKQITFLLATVFGFAFFSEAQVNLIVGGDMESADSWLVTTLETDASNSSSFEFGYTSDMPAEGSNGVLHYTITNTGANGAHLMFYQQVTVVKGKRYMANIAAKAIQEMNNSWFEVYIGETEPVDGSDYGSGATALGGFKWSGWEEGCTGLDLFDGTLQNDGCLAGSNGEFMIEGEGEVIMYFGFKAGIWASETTVEFVVDNVELIALEETSTILQAESKTKLFPNPVNNELQVISDLNYAQAKVFNILGKEVLNIPQIQSSINVANLKAGIYIIELQDANNNKQAIRFQKK